jgi:hypothetical protein
MAGIANDTVKEFQDRIGRFRLEYVNDWNRWLSTQDASRPRELKAILGSWQACRGNTLHDEAGMTKLLNYAKKYLVQLQSFDLRRESDFTPPVCNAVTVLWGLFQERLCYVRVNPDRKNAPPHGGLAGAVGISKAAMLATDGRLGPAFDSKVRTKLGCGKIATAADWLEAMRAASRDIATFENRWSTTLQIASNYPFLHTGRIYDMALGPG